jgi:aspartate 1-decarboxylase
MNGAAARLAQPGDILIIISYATMSDEEARRYSPRVVLVDANNRIVRVEVGETSETSTPLNS